MDDSDFSPQEASYRSVIKLNLTELANAVDMELQNLEREREELTRAKKVWIQENQKLSAAEIGNTMTLNVGGTQFACSVDLLRKIPHTFFAGLVSGRWNLNRQKDGSIFIDRDPTVFPFIMTYMRKYGTGFDLAKWLSNVTDREKMLLKDEAKFYMIPHLQDFDWSEPTSATLAVRPAVAYPTGSIPPSGVGISALKPVMVRYVENIYSALTIEREELDEDQEAFQKEKEVWVEQERRLKEAQISHFITLNVSGSIFSSSVDTLLKLPDTFFSGLASGRWDSQKNESDDDSATSSSSSSGSGSSGEENKDHQPAFQPRSEFFIDRDPIVFPLIMTYMRKLGTDFDMDQWLLSLTNLEKMLLEEEASFFIIPDLITPFMGNIISKDDWKVIHPRYEKRRLLQKWTNTSECELKAFHLPNMVLLIKCADGTILGAFTSIAWKSDQGHYFQHDDRAKLFCKPSPSALLTSHSVISPQQAFFLGNKRFCFGSHDLAINRTTGAVKIHYNPGGVDGRSYYPLAVKGTKNATQVELWCIDRD